MRREVHSVTDSGHFSIRVDAPWRDAEESLLRVAPTARIASGADHSHRMRIDGDDRFSLLRFTVAGELEAHSDPSDAITITAVRHGWMRWQIGEERGTSDVPWMQSMTAPTTSRFESLDEDALFLKQQPLLALARALYGDERLELTFDGPLPVDRTRGDLFSSTLTYASQIAASGLLEHPILRASLYRHLAVSLLECYRLHGDAHTRRITAEGRLRRYRIASQFIEDHASLPISLEDVARAADISSLELNSIFRGHGPSGDARTQLRRARLAAAHDDLVRSDPTLGDTVREIAHRWGYPNPSTFAKHYRQQYGVPPKHVLDR